MNPDIAVDDGEMVVQNELHTKYATPRRLSQELKILLGGTAQYKVEMRHNIYNIKSTKPFDVETLVTKCQRHQRGNTIELDLGGL